LTQLKGKTRPRYRGRGGLGETVHATKLESVRSIAQRATVCWGGRGIVTREKSKGV